MTIRFPRGVEEGQFKRVPDGWLFTTVSPWVFGPRQTYVVSEAQKPAIAACVRRARYLRLILMLAMMPLLLAAFLIAPSLLDSRSLAGWLALGGYVAVFAIVTATCERRILRPLLRDLPRTSQKIRLTEMLRNQSEAMSVKALSIMTLLPTLAAAGSIYQSFTPSNNALFMALSAILCAVSAIVFFGMLVIKLRAKAD